MPFFHKFIAKFQSRTGRAGVHTVVMPLALKDGDKPNLRIAVFHLPASPSLTCKTTLDLDGAVVCAATRKARLALTIRTAEQIAFLIRLKCVSSICLIQKFPQEPYQAWEILPGY